MAKCLRIVKDNSSKFWLLSVGKVSVIVSIWAVRGQLRDLDHFRSTGGVILTTYSARFLACAEFFQGRPEVISVWADSADTIISRRSKSFSRLCASRLGSLMVTNSSCCCSSSVIPIVWAYSISVILKIAHWSKRPKKLQSRFLPLSDYKEAGFHFKATEPKTAL